MDNFSDYWGLVPHEQETYVEKRGAQTQEEGIPTQYTLTGVYDEVDIELAMCASGLFIMIVQDRCELGGGYGLQALALGKYVQRHFETKEAVEAYLEARCAYKSGSTVWIPLPNYHSYMDETKIWRRFNEEAEREEEARS